MQALSQRHKLPKKKKVKAISKNPGPQLRIPERRGIIDNRYLVNNSPSKRSLKVDDELRIDNQENQVMTDDFGSPDVTYHMRQNEQGQDEKSQNKDLLTASKNEDLTQTNLTAGKLSNNKTDKLKDLNQGNSKITAN